MERTLRDVTCACILVGCSAACGSKTTTDRGSDQNAGTSETTITEETEANTGRFGDVHQTDAAIPPAPEAGVHDDSTPPPTGFPTDECSSATSEQACLALSDTFAGDGFCRWLQVETVHASGNTCETLSSEPACIFFGSNQRGGCGSQCASGAPHFRVRGDDSILLRHQRFGCDVPGHPEHLGWEECDDTNPIGACLCSCVPPELRTR